MDKKQETQSDAKTAATNLNREHAKIVLHHVSVLRRAGYISNWCFDTLKHDLRNLTMITRNPE